MNEFKEKLVKELRFQEMYDKVKKKENENKTKNEEENKNE